MIGLIARPHVSVVSATTPNEDPNSYQAAFPKTNMFNNDYGRVAARTSNATAFWMGFDLGTAKPVDVVALLWHNLPAAATISVRAGTSVSGAEAGELYSANALPSMTGATARDVAPALSKFLLTLAAPVSARYWGILISNVPANYVAKFSRLFLGKGATFAIGPQKATLGAKDMNANVTTEVGEQRSQEDGGLIRPVVSLSFEYGKQSEMEQVLGQYTLGLGVSRPLLICTDLTTPYLQDNLAFGRPEKVVTLESSIYDVWSFEAVVTSLGV